MSDKDGLLSKEYFETKTHKGCVSLFRLVVSEIANNNAQIEELTAQNKQLETLRFRLGRAIDSDLEDLGQKEKSK